MQVRKQSSYSLIREILLKIELHILDNEGNWFVSSVKEAIYTKWIPLNKGGGLQHHHSSTYVCSFTIIVLR